MSSKQITKSDYAAGVQCEKRLYLLHSEPDLAAAPSDDLQMRFEQGQEIGKLARSRFPNGVLVGASGSALNHAILTTTKLIEELKTEAIFEAAVKFENYAARIDILKNNFDGTWDLIEVKSTTEVKPEHLEDVAFQLWVLKNSNVKIKNVFLSHINNQVVFPNIEDIFTDHDFTEEAHAKLSQIEMKARSLLSVVEKENAPEVAIGRHCANPYGCEFKSECWAAVPKGSVLELYNYRKRKPTKFELFHQGPQLIENLRNEVELTRFQQIQFMASQSDDPIIDHLGLTEFLGKVRYPIYYFDFETIAPAIPILNGMRPYQRIPVQFSCHVQKSPHGELEHHEFLASGKEGSDPRRECLEEMKKVFTSSGTIIAYHDDFERSLIRELSAYFVEDSDFLNALEQDFWDLEDAFHNHFYHRDFGGSVSIKKVLPYFSPEMKYDKLEIKNGGQAQAALMKLLSYGVSDLQREKLRRDLLTYCAQDSMAMVVIHHKLLEIIEKGNLRIMRT
ncbi:MAG: DUF2779 domain-containing protein [Deltaproteobacteria bacterium]|nr:DUF2779 domain-containing protein [Deltaproteobacteria bacterium]